MTELKLTSFSPASLAVVTGIALVGLVLSGCKGVPTKEEKEARQQAASVAADYRPHGERPPLPVLTTNSGLSNFLTYAMLNVPKVEEAYYDWLASIERITIARSFPDPQFTFQMDVQNAVTSVMPGLMGAIPWPSKLRVGAQVASAEAQAKYYNFQSAVLETAFAVKQAYYQLYFLSERIRVNQETLVLLTDLEKLARTQNEVGKVTLQDVLRAQIEEDRLRNDTANLEDSRSSLEIRFKAALGLHANDPAPPMPARFESSPLETTPDKLLETAFAQNTRLKELEAEVRAAVASIRAAQKAKYPDFNLGFMADAKTDPTLYRFPGNPGTMSLPIWRDKIASQIAEAQDAKHSAAARLSAEQLALAVGFVEKSVEFREATRSLNLLEHELLPKQRESLEVARVGYVSGQIDFFNLTDAEQTLLKFRLDEVEARTQRELSLAELSLVIQGMSPTGTRIGPGPGSTGMGGGPQARKTGAGM